MARSKTAAAAAPDATEVAAEAATPEATECAGCADLAAELRELRAFVLGGRGLTPGMPGTEPRLLPPLQAHELSFRTVFQNGDPSSAANCETAVAAAVAQGELTVGAAAFYLQLLAAAKAEGERRRSVARHDRERVDEERLAERERNKPPENVTASEQLEAFRLGVRVDDLRERRAAAAAAPKPTPPPPGSAAAALATFRAKEDNLFVPKKPAPDRWVTAAHVDDEDDEDML